MSAAVLGVENSLGEVRWQASPCLHPSNRLERKAKELGQTYKDMPVPVTYLLAAKVLEGENHETYLQPTLRDLLPDPSSFRDMDRAASRLADAVQERTPVGIFGDYDVDGAASAALLIRILRRLGIEADFHIPDRRREGYGPNAEALSRLLERGAGLIVTVDCGITAHQPLSAVTEKGIDVVVIDHHLADAELPMAHSVVNPNRLDDESSHGYLCAAGVTFIVLVALLRELRARDFFATGREEPDLLEELDIVGLATVCDVVPMKGLNRAFVKQGVKAYAGRCNQGLATLGDLVAEGSAPSAYTFGFLLGPRINAAGRVGEAELGVRLLSTSDPSEASGIAMALEGHNQTRRELEREATDQAVTMAQAQKDSPVIMVRDARWHEGVVGIVAGRLCEATGKPALVMTSAQEGEWRGSGRSLAGFRLGSAVLAARETGILQGGGGHDMAAGFRLREDRLDEFHEFLCARFRKEMGSETPRRSRVVSGFLSARGLDAGLLAWLAMIGPYGSGNPEPRFVLPECRVRHARLVGRDKAHVSCGLDDGTGGQVRAIMFNGAGTPAGKGIMDAREGSLIHVLGRVRRYPFGNEDAVQFQVEDAAPVAAASARNRIQ